MGLFIYLDVNINGFIQMFTHKSACVYRKWNSNAFTLSFDIKEKHTRASVVIIS